MIILYPYINRVPFIDGDIKELRKTHQVIEYNFPMAKNAFYIWNVLIFLVFILTHKIDVVFGWFCDYHFLAPALLKKRVVISVGGYDAFGIQSLQHGIYLSNSWRAKIARFIARRAVLLPVHSSLEKSVDVTCDRGLQGITHFTGSKCRATIPCGYDNEVFYKSVPMCDRLNVITTIGIYKTKKDYIRKGIDVFLEAAEIISKYGCQHGKEPPTFYVIGGKPMTDYVPSNVIFYDFTTQEELARILNATKVYCQFSRAEGLPHTLLEAMACGCVPVGSYVNGIPVFLPRKRMLMDFHSKSGWEAARIIMGAMNESNEELSNRQTDLVKHYTLKRRIERINQLL